MHAFLIIGKTAGDRQKEIDRRLAEASVSPFDVVRVPDDVLSVGIADIRAFTRALSIAANAGGTKAGVLNTIDRLTPESQNALLKPLEEPPPHTIILAETGNPDTLLPTILSRCTLISLGSQGADTSVDYTALVQEILAATPGKRLMLLDPYTGTREDASAFLHAVTVSVHAMLVATPTDPSLAKLLKNLLLAHSQLSVNVNPKLVIDNCFL
jgi:hypothetical protein